jgi:hypothetical protein
METPSQCIARGFNEGIAADAELRQHVARERWLGPAEFVSSTP